jgi:hypothetical protein
VMMRASPGVMFHSGLKRATARNDRTTEIG